MGMILKVIGGLTIFGWVVMAVGCTMLTHAIGNAGGAAALRDASDRQQVARALQNGEIDATSLPSGVESGDHVTITLRDGSRRTLGTSPEDRLLRMMLAEKAQTAAGGTYRSRAEPDYSYSGNASRPHFKPGEPMVNPNPGGSYDN